MSEFPLSSTEECSKRKKIGFSSLLLSDFHLLCSFILSHPLYFSYLLFFSPYIIKVLSFLSPLFITTTLLLLALLSTLCAHDASDHEFPETQPSLLFSVYRKLGGVSHSKFDVKDDDSVSFEELEAYKMVFEACPSEMGGNPVDVLEQDCEEACSARELMFVDKFCSHESTKTATTLYETSMEDSNEKPVVIPLSKIDELMSLEEEKEETKKCEKEQEEEVKPVNVVVQFNKGEEGQIGKLPTRKESKATRGFSNKVHPTQAEKVASQDEDSNNDADDYNNDLPRLSDFLGKISPDSGEKENEDSKQENNTLGSFGSMRKEKEWRRTLACKLFEERHKADVVDRGGGDGGEGMDLLWETYETEADNVSRRRSEASTHMEKEKKKMMMKMKNKKKSINDQKKDVFDDGDCDGDDDGDGQLCCLQALKFSTGKMHLGMGRPNLVKISKAIKGIGWFHHVAKNGKKA